MPRHRPDRVDDADDLRVAGCPAGPTSSSVSPRVEVRPVRVRACRRSTPPSRELGVGLGLARRPGTRCRRPSAASPGRRRSRCPASAPFLTPGSSSGIARIGATVPASGIASIAAATERGTPGPPPCSIVKPCACTVKSRAKTPCPIWSSIVPTKLADIELLTTTTESPIVSATAVAAVRSGLDRSESAASRPPVGSRRRIGTASQRIDRHDHERRGDRHAGEHRHRHRDPAVGGEAAGLALAAEPERAAEPEPGKEQREARSRAAASMRVRRTWASPSTARIGEIRPARRAGQNAPSRVTTMPMTAAVTAGARR